LNKYFKRTFSLFFPLSSLFALMAVLTFYQAGSAQTNLIEIKSVRVGDLKFAGFSLKSAKGIKISAIGAGEKKVSPKERSFMSDPNDMFAYGWILNAKTRDLVWRMTIDNTSRERGSRYNRKFDDEIKLPAGDYEVYYSAQLPDFGLFDDGFFSLGKLFNKLFQDKDWYEEDQQKWYLTVENVDAVLEERSVIKYHSAVKEQAVVSLTRLKDSEFRQEGFNLSKPGKFEVYAIGESYRDEVFDYGWIVDANTSEKIWETLPERADYAGGASKNKYWKDDISLKPGSYWVYFVMDDSHSPDAWNANPPYDPDFYGITLTGLKGEFDPKSIEKVIKQKVQPIVELTRLGDDEFVQEGFKLAAPIQVRIYAIGEGRRGEMFDYGWIVDMDTGEKVWEMNYNRTREAGGADKNRLVDEIITLGKGSYMVYFITDDSHSFRHWNSTRPFNPSSWGITIYPADPKYNTALIKKLEDTELQKGIIAQIVKVQDGRHYQERFELTKPEQIRIYAIGEGDWDEMYDYGWIKNADTGETIWEMTYQKTTSAGGARKNRKVDQIITLPAGKYIVMFETDGSHSFNDWNDDPPDDPIHYGITLYKVSD
jgi:hypothetical protein